MDKWPSVTLVHLPNELDDPVSEGIRILANNLTQQWVPKEIFECYRAAEAGTIRIGEGPFYTNTYRSLRRALGLTRVTAAPNVVAPRGDTPKDGLRGDGCRDRLAGLRPVTDFLSVADARRLKIAFAAIVFRVSR